MADPQAEHEAALLNLTAWKALCRAACSEADAAVAAIEEKARAAASVAHHILANPRDPLAAAFGAGRMLSQTHLAAVHAAVQAGGDPVAAAGADPADVATLAAADDTHGDHAQALGDAYARYAAASAAVAETQPPPAEPPALVGPPQGVPF